MLTILLVIKAQSMNLGRAHQVRAPRWVYGAQTGASKVRGAKMLSSHKFRNLT